MRHVDRCRRCRFRIQREAGLRAERAREGTIEAPPDALLYTSMPSSVGTLWLAGGPEGLLAVEYAVDEARFVHEVERIGRDTLWYVPDALPDAREQIDEYLAGTRRQFDLALDLRRLTEFRRIVFEAVRAIPYGEVRAYGEVASEIGRHRAGRAVGAAVSGCAMSFVIPCHRVVRSGGRPGIYAPRTLGPCGVAYQAAFIAHERDVSSARSSIQ